MKIIRKTYIPNLNLKESLASKMIMLVSLMIILVLLVMLLFSNLNNIQTIIKIPYIEKLSAEMSNEYSEVSNRLIKLKNEEVELNKKTSSIKENAAFYDSISEIAGIRIKIAQSLKKSLDTKGILRDNGKYIFVNEYGNLSLLNSYVFDGKDSAMLTKSASESIKLLGNEMYKILQDKELAKYIKFFAIEGHISNTQMNEANKTLANQRSQNYLHELLSNNQKLNDEYSNKFISSNCYDNEEIKNKIEGIDDYSRIEISVYIDEAAIEEGISTFFNNDNSDSKDKKIK